MFRCAIESRQELVSTTAIFITVVFFFIKVKEGRRMGIITISSTVSVTIGKAGYGEKLSGRSAQSQAERNTLVNSLIDKLGLNSKKISVVAASMGGSYGWPFVTRVSNILFFLKTLYVVI